MRTALSFFGAFVAMYLVTAFIRWEFNPNEWGEGARFWYMWVSAMFGGLAALMSITSPFGDKP